MNVIHYNALIASVGRGSAAHALEVYEDMRRREVRPAPAAGVGESSGGRSGARVPSSSGVSLLCLVAPRRSASSS